MATVTTIATKVRLLLYSYSLRMARLSERIIQIDEFCSVGESYWLHNWLHQTRHNYYTSFILRNKCLPDSDTNAGHCFDIETYKHTSLVSQKGLRMMIVYKVCIKSPWTVVWFLQIVYFISDYQRLCKQLPKLVKLQNFYSMMSCLMNVD